VNSIGCNTVLGVRTISRLIGCRAQGLGPFSAARPLRILNAAPELRCCPATDATHDLCRNLERRSSNAQYRGQMRSGEAEGRPLTPSPAPAYTPRARQRAMLDLRLLVDQPLLRETLEKPPMAIWASSGPCRPSMNWIPDCEGEPRGPVQRPISIRSVDQIVEPVGRGWPR